jgi:hypothetical protein
VAHFCPQSYANSLNGECCDHRRPANLPIHMISQLEIPEKGLLVPTGIGHDPLFDGML